MLFVEVHFVLFYVKQIQSNGSGKILSSYLIGRNCEYCDYDCERKL